MVPIFGTKQKKKYICFQQHQYFICSHACGSVFLFSTYLICLLTSGLVFVNGVPTTLRTTRQQKISYSMYQIRAGNIADCSIFLIL
jgi:hypothetical protein